MDENPYQSPRAEFHIPQKPAAMKPQPPQKSPLEVACWVVFSFAIGLGLLFLLTLGQ